MLAISATVNMIAIIIPAVEIGAGDADELVLVFEEEAAAAEGAEGKGVGTGIAEVVDDVVVLRSVVVLDVELEVDESAVVVLEDETMEVRNVVGVDEELVELEDVLALAEDDEDACVELVDLWVVVIFVELSLLLSELEVDVTMIVELAAVASVVEVA